MKKAYTNSELCMIWLDSFVGLEYKHKQEIYRHINGSLEIKKVLVSGKDYFESQIGTERYNLLLSSANPVYLKFLLDGLEKREVTALTVVSNDYPEQLVNTDLPPLVLYAKGDLSLLKQKCFAIVGSRKSLPISIRLTEDFTSTLIDAGFVPVTGIAEGVDKAVIDTALKNGGKVISVLAGGLDYIYPKSHQTVIEKVFERGLVIGEYPPETQVRPYHFPIRNRIIAGLSQGALIVSAGKKSGTLYTAEYAEQYGRDLFAVPYSVGISSGAGCNDLIKRGATLVDTPDDILSFYRIEKEQKQPLSITDSEREIIEVLKDGDAHLEKIASITGKKVFEITPTLQIMEIKGLVVKTGVNIFGLGRNDLED